MRWPAIVINDDCLLVSNDVVSATATSVCLISKKAHRSSSRGPDAVIVGRPAPRVIQTGALTSATSWRPRSLPAPAAALIQGGAERSSGQWSADTVQSPSGGAGFWSPDCRSHGWRWSILTPLHQASPRNSLELYFTKIGRKKQCTVRTTIPQLL